MVTEVVLKTANMKAGSWGDPIWIAELQRGESKGQIHSPSLATHMRLLPEALLEALKYAKEHWPDDVVLVHCRNEYVVLGMVAWRFNWASNGWLKADGSPLEHQDLWPQLHDLAKDLTVLFADAHLYKNRATTSRSSTVAKHFNQHDALLRKLELGPYSPLF
ncbi:hypothetical protein [Deinococcus arcticus]|uniref:hypothetical protein n=1 Tax=Deinococcus arcticus TaxID=2136176 RepID=UPI0011B1F6CB|nr:hypothetical protein [Deinococcus arcticus]